MKIKNLLILFLTFSLFAVFFTNVEIISQSIISSLNFCFFSLISSLFPYMVLVGIITESACIDGLLERIDNRLFFKLGVCKKYIVSVVLGCICGFVVGARAICERYKKSGSLNDGFSDAVILSSNAGVGFVIGCIGIKIWGDAVFGIYLYIIQLLSAFFIHIALKEKISDINFTKSSLRKGKSFLSSLSTSITSSCISMLYIIAFVVFYSLLFDSFVNIFKISNKSYFYGILYSVLEFGRGSFIAVGNDNVVLSAFLSGFCIGFGGLCVYSQILSVCEALPFNKSKYIIIKSAQGIICGIFSCIYITARGIKPKPLYTNVFASKQLNFISICFIILCIAVLLQKSIKKFIKTIDFCKK